jgi:type I restriction enzyme, S subunit
MNADRLLVHYERIADAPDAIGRLRHFIVNLAVRGKLVPQDPITERLAKAYDGESASKELPTSWRLLNFGKFCDIEGGNQPPKSQFISQPKRGYVRLLQIRDLGERPVPTFIPIGSTNRFCKEGEILIGRYGASVGKLFWAQNGAYNVAMAKFIWPDDALISSFAFLLLKSEYLQGPLARATRSAQAGFNKSDLAAINFPPPPLAEQYRIIAKVDELIALCDRLETVRTEREATRDRLAAASLARLSAPDPDTFQDDTRFAINNLAAITTRSDQVKQLRQTILNLAVRGKLVPQDPQDEPAAELLKRIAKERTAPQEIKKARRNGEAEISNLRDDTPLPFGWCWTNVDEIALSMRYGTSTKCEYASSGVPVLRIPNVSGGCVSIDDIKFGPLTESEIRDLALNTGDLLLIRSNGSLDIVGRSAVVPAEADGMAFAGYLVRLRLSLSDMKPEYVWLTLNSTGVRDQIERPIRSAVGLKNINLTEFGALTFPLPPLAEQHRIVAKVDELMALCDRLEASLDTAADTRRRLLEALLAEALAPSVPQEAVRMAAHG